LRIISVFKVFDFGILLLLLSGGEGKVYIVVFYENVMTVINMLSFGESGVAVADEQSSTELRKYNIAQKLRPIGKSIVYGGSGPSDLLTEIYDFSIKGLGENQDKDLRSVYEYITNIALSRRDRLLDTMLKAEFSGLGMEDIQSGVSSITGKPLDQEYKSRLHNGSEGIKKNLSFGILLGGIEDGRFNVYGINAYGSGLKSSRGLGTDGSGSDESDKVISSYKTSIPREETDNIDPEEGLIKVIEATNSSVKINNGVGGTISIAHISDEGIKMPSEDNCRLASEIVSAYIEGFIDQNTVKGLLRQIVPNEGEFKKIESEFRESVPNWNELDRFFRGYKH